MTVTGNLFTYLFITRQNEWDTAYSVECDDMRFSDFSVINLSAHKTNKHNVVILTKLTPATAAGVPHSYYRVLTQCEISALHSTHSKVFGQPASLTA